MSNPNGVSYATTIHVRDHCLCLHTQRAARTLARLFDDALRPAGLNNGQFSLMMSLNRPDPASIGSVAALLAMDRTTLTAALKVLQRRGWITVAPDPADKRSRLLRLTPAGHEVLIRATPIWEATHRQLDARLPDADRLRQDLVSIARPDRGQMAGPPPVA
jgi:DNA-binding MarR family transcriptional regulator